MLLLRSCRFLLFFHINQGKSNREEQGEKKAGQMLRDGSEQLLLASRLQRLVLLIGDPRWHLYG